VSVEGGHKYQGDRGSNDILAWLDRYLGPVK
jgi:hypothetical protein